MQNIGIDLGSYTSLLSSSKSSIIYDSLSKRSSKSVFDLTTPRKFGNHVSDPKRKTIAQRKYLDSFENIFYYCNYLRSLVPEQVHFTMAVPYFFTLHERHELKELLSGVFPNLSFVTDVVGVAHLYALKYEKGRECSRFCVVDLGHSKTTVGCFVNAEDRIEPLFVKGIKVGAKDFDEAIVSFILKKFKIEETVFNVEKIKMHVEKIKMALNNIEDFRFNLEIGEDSFYVVITKQEYHELIKEKLHEIEKFVDSIPELKDCVVEVVGGNSQNAFVRHVLEQKIKIHFSLNAEESVANGAALSGAIRRFGSTKKISLNNIYTANLFMRIKDDEKGSDLDSINLDESNNGHSFNEINFCCDSAKDACCDSAQNTDCCNSAKNNDCSLKDTGCDKRMCINKDNSCNNKDNSCNNKDSCGNKKCDGQNKDDSCGNKKENNSINDDQSKKVKNILVLKENLILPTNTFKLTFKNKTNFTLLFVEKKEGNFYPVEEIKIFNVKENESVGVKICINKNESLQVEIENADFAFLKKDHSRTFENETKMKKIESDLEKIGNLRNELEECIMNIEPEKLHLSEPEIKLLNMVREEMMYQPISETIKEEENLRMEINKRLSFIGEKLRKKTEGMEGKIKNGLSEMEEFCKENKEFYVKSIYKLYGCINRGKEIFKGVSFDIFGIERVMRLEVDLLLGEMHELKRSAEVEIAVEKKKREEAAEKDNLKEEEKNDNDNNDEKNDDENDKEKRKCEDKNDDEKNDDENDEEK